MNKILVKLVIIMVFVSLIWNLKEKVIDPYLFYMADEEKRMYVAVYDKEKREIIDSSIMMVTIEEEGIKITYQNAMCLIPIQNDLVSFPDAGPYPCFNDKRIDWKIYLGKGCEEIIIQNAKVSDVSEHGWGWSEHSQIFHIATRKNVNNIYDVERILNKVISD